jgi:polysaccharide pyruvyl transferase WcaK-like protein
MKKITVRGAYGETNFGDDLLMCVFENFFLSEFARIQLNFVGEKNNYAQKLLVNSSYMQADFTPDWEVYGGGTQFFAFQKHSKLTFAEKVNIAVKNPTILLEKIKSVLFRSSKLSNVSKKVFIGFGIGPFHGNEQAISYAKEKITEADFVGVRDEVSYQYCLDWKIDAKLGADVVFSSYFTKPALQNIVSSTEKKKIGIIVRDWDWEKSGKNYIDNLMSFYKSFKDADLKFIIFAPSKDKKWVSILKEEDVLVWDPNKYMVSSFLEELNEFDGFITARYHGAIVAALMDKPVICIEVEPKLRILTEQVKEIMLWEKPFDNNQLIDLLNHLDFNVNYKNSLTERKEKADAMLLEFKNKFK